MPIQIKQSLNRAKAMIKRRILPFLFLLSLLLVFTQCNYNHLKFEGLTIDGPMEPFLQQLEKKGFKRQQGVDDMAYLKGSFAGKDSCNLFVLRNVERDLIYRVVVALPPKDTWEELESDFKYMRAQLVKTYGAPKYETQEYDGLENITKNETKMLLLNEGKCRYTATWEVDGGTIYLEISHIRANGRNCVRVLYYDKVNDVVAEN